MLNPRLIRVVLIPILILGLVAVSFATREPAKPYPPPREVPGGLDFNGPFVMLQAGDTTWVTVHMNGSYCPGDPLGGHGGEATGGPVATETWCFENAEYSGAGMGGDPVTTSDTCGTNSPWTYLCFDHIDVRSLSSQTDTNYWHLDSHRTDERTWCGDYCLWCGSESLWTDGNPVECDTWVNAPGYGNQWDCIVELELADTFDVSYGCTLHFDTRYDTECRYDYFYVDFDDGNGWVTLATFNASSNTYGIRCGPMHLPTPDYWGGTDWNQPDTAGWQERYDPGLPAFYRVIIPDTLRVTRGPAFRWRFVSDGAWSDADGLGDTDGGAFIDNVWIWGDRGNRYEEDFEDNSWSLLASRGWRLKAPDPVAQCWHQIHDPDPPYEGGDGGDQTTCTHDSSVVWRARPDGGYLAGAPWRNGWFYRLLSPKVPVTNSGCALQYDQYMCAADNTCDYTDTKVRFHNTVHGWCPWMNIDGYVLYGGCTFWNFDFMEDVSSFFGPGADTVQFAWDVMDLSQPSDFCRGKHAGTDNQIDNVSIGFYDASATQFRVQPTDLLHDTFHDSVCSYSSHMIAGLNGVDLADTMLKYARMPHRVMVPPDYKFNITVTDRDTLALVELCGSIDKGATWILKPMLPGVPMDPARPELGGIFYETFCPPDFGFIDWKWPRGTEVWYCVRATDKQMNVAYFPDRASPGHPDHEHSVYDYLSYSIFPLYPPGYTGTKILLVDGFGRWITDWSQCVEEVDNRSSGIEHGLEDIYEQTLIDAGYCYDKYDINAAGCNVHIHPRQFTDYDAVIWFTGPYLAQYLVDGFAQDSLKTYLYWGGKIIICGDRLAFNMAEPYEGGLGCDSIGGIFEAGVMGCDYLGEMASPFDRPYIYMQGVNTIEIFHSPVALGLDSLLIYRGCPGRLKEMSYIRTNPAPPPGYLTQPLVRVLNPEPPYDPADGAVYIEDVNCRGQSVLINFDLSAMVNHTEQYCTGTTPPPAESFYPGVYGGRVELFRTILEDIFGLTPPSPGGGGTARIEPRPVFRWALAQNAPNPCRQSTDIRYEIACAGRVSIKIYDARGRLVRTLVDERGAPGRYAAHWDGTNASGRRVSSGLYFYKMESADFTATRKMLLVE